MAELELTSDLTVELIQQVGSDAAIARAARVSTGADSAEYDAAADAKLINYLMKNRHGSPFEHNSMTFRVSAPIFVIREFMRHRIGWSYNEVSARYKKLEPRFYIYPEHRPLIQSGSSAHPDITAGEPELTVKANEDLVKAYQATWNAYQTLLEHGVAYEVARAVLPVGIYSDMYVTCNARSLMAFLSLRVDEPTATFQTKPQWEIEQVARQMESKFSNIFRATWDSFDLNGRVAP
jgi:thymidylate synthase (FAD)